MRAHDEALHRDQVVQHGSMRRHLVAPPDRVEDPPVVRVRSGRSTGRVEGLLATLGEQVHERPDDPRDGAIVGTVGDGGVERRVLATPVRPWRTSLDCSSRMRSISTSSSRVARRAASAAIAGSSNRRASNSSPTASR